MEEYLGDNFSDGEQSVPLNGSHTQLAYLPPDKMTAFSRLSRFGMMFKPLTEDLGEALLMSYREDFLAKTSQLQEKEMDLMAKDLECGVKWRGSFAKWDQDSSLWRTHQCSLLGDLEPFSETFPQWGLMRNGELWEQKTLVQTTKEIEFGFGEKLPTPQASDYRSKPTSASWKAKGGVNFCLSNPEIQETWTKQAEPEFFLTPTVMDALPPRNPEALERQYQNNRKGRSTHSTLREQVVYPPPKQMFPTPRSCSAMASTITPESAWDEKRNPNLETIVGRRMFPTPNAWDGKRGPRSEEHLRTKKAQVTLVTAVAQMERENFPTPCSTDYKGAGQSGKLRDRLDYAAERGATKNKTFTEPTVPGGQLNPTWVEKLMGWPENFTSLNAISHVKMTFWLMGFYDDSERCTKEVLQLLRHGTIQEEIQQQIGRSVSILEATVLLSQLCEYTNKSYEARIFFSCQKILEEQLRSLWTQQDASCTPYRPEHQEQFGEQHPDTMQALSQLLAHYGKKAWQDSSWENAIPRVDRDIKARVERLKAIGNGQVPLCAATAWELLK